MEAVIGIWRIQFFRRKLLILTLDEIEELEEQYLKDIDNIRAECYKMAWHMRGAVSVSEMMMMSYTDRTAVADLIKEHMEITKTSGLPYF